MDVVNLEGDFQINQLPVLTPEKMANANRVRFFLLPKPTGLQRVADKRKLVIGEIIQNGLPHSGEFYVYARLRSSDAAITEDQNSRRRFRCYFDELDIDDNTATGRRGVLHLYGRSVTEIVHCVRFPANVLLCNFQLASDPIANDQNRINPFDIELELDDDRSVDGKIYQVEESEDSDTPLGDEYVKLADVVRGPKLSVYAVVKSVVEPENGKLRLTLTDPSLDIDRHIICHLVSDSPDALPRQAKVGDVLRLHRISAEDQHGVIKLFGNMGKAGLSWLLFNGTPGSDLTPVSSSVKFTLRDSDTEMARVLRSWFTINSRKPPSGNPVRAQTNEDIKLLKDFQLKAYGNVLLQVVGVFESLRSNRPVIIRGWDGTKCSRQSIKVDPEREQLPIHSYDKTLNETIGDYTIDVFVYDQYREPALTLKSGHFVLLSNVHFYFNEPSLGSFTLHGGPRGYYYGRDVKAVDSTDSTVMGLCRRLDETISKLPAEKLLKVRKRKGSPPKTSEQKTSSIRFSGRRAASLSPTLRPLQDAGGTKQTPLKVRHISAASRTQANSKAGPSGATASPKKSRTEPSPIRHASHQPQLRSATPVSTVNSSQSHADDLRRRPLSQERFPRLRTPSPLRQSPPGRSPKAVTIRSGILDDSTHSQTPTPFMQKKTTPDQVGPTRVTEADHSPTRRAGKDTSPQLRVRRAAAQKVFFDPDVNPSSLSDEESESSSDQESGSWRKSVGKRRLRNLRNRSIRIESSPSQSPKRRSPNAKKGGSGKTTPRARRGKK